jgi:hypothetical protein
MNGLDYHAIAVKAKDLIEKSGLSDAKKKEILTISEGNYERASILGKKVAEFKEDAKTAALARLHADKYIIREAKLNKLM